MIPTPGQIVEYTLSEQDASQINRRRKDAREALKAGTVGNTGFALHVGNEVRSGEKYPLVIIRVWNQDPGACNGQVLLDGNDTLWVTSVVPGDGERKFRPFPV